MEESTSDGSSKSWTQFAHYFARCQYEPIWGAPPSTERSRSWESQSSTGSQRHWRRRELAQGPPLQQTRRQSLVVEIARENRATPLREPCLLAHVRVRKWRNIGGGGNGRRKRANCRTNSNVLVEAAGVGPPRYANSRMFSRTRKAQSARNDGKPPCRYKTGTADPPSSTSIHGSSGSSFANWRT